MEDEPSNAAVATVTPSERVDGSTSPVSVRGCTPDKAAATATPSSSSPSSMTSSVSLRCHPGNMQRAGCSGSI